MKADLRRHRPGGLARALGAAILVLGAALPSQADTEAGRQAIGRGDYASARRELQPDAERGDAFAQHQLGILVHLGRGGERDAAQALDWIRRAAEQGDNAAQFSLGTMHYFGHAAPADKPEAARWWRLAADQGHSTAQLNLGIMLRAGDGVERDPVAAAMWFMLASRGNKDAAAALRSFAQDLSVEQRERAQSLAADWRPRVDGPTPRRVAAAAEAMSSAGGYWALRRAHETRLLRRQSAPAEGDARPPAGVQEVQFASGKLNLKAWLLLPRRSAGQRLPAVVFFHGGFSLNEGDLRTARTFADRGIAVLLPALRGENGNPGHFELFYGEVEDGAAAVHWLAARPEIDPQRIYTFGHSVGGAISALLSLWDDLPVRLGGSAGGLYSADVFDDWRRSGQVPFDLSDGIEARLRLLAGNTRYMRRPHVAYVGADDFALRGGGEDALAESGREGGKLELAVMPGDHATSLRPAVAAFATLIESQR